MATDNENADAALAAIASAIQGPKRASGDAGSVEQFDLKDMIEASKYLQSQAAASSPTRGLRFNKLVPDGTAGRGHRWPHNR